MKKALSRLNRMAQAFCITMAVGLVIYALLCTALTAYGWTGLSVDYGACAGACVVALPLEMWLYQRAWDEPQDG